MRPIACGLGCIPIVYIYIYTSRENFGTKYTPILCVCDPLSRTLLEPAAVCANNSYCDAVGAVCLNTLVDRFVSEIKPNVYDNIHGVYIYNIAQYGYH